MEAKVKLIVSSRLILSLAVMTIACKKSAKIYEIKYAVDTTTDGTNWAEAYSGNASDEGYNNLRTTFLNSIRSDAYVRCYPSSGVSKARGYLVSGSSINRQIDKPEFDLTCDEIRAKKVEWGF